ncbi:MAG: hypothetical protein ACYDD6_08855, partial [Acidimicrobiales bacterium]
MPTSPRLAVLCADALDAAALAAATEGVISAVGIPVLMSETGPRLAEGVPSRLAVAEQAVVVN